MFPTDARLIDRARTRLVRLAQKRGVAARQSWPAPRHAVHPGRGSDHDWRCHARTERTHGSGPARRPVARLVRRQLAGAYEDARRPSLAFASHPFIDGNSIELTV